MSLSQTSVAKLYSTVIDDVISGVREFFADEGVDEQVLLELKNNWESRLVATKAVEPKPDPEPQPPTLKQNAAANKSATNNHTGQNVSAPQHPITPQGVQRQTQLTQPQQSASLPVDVSTSKNVAIQITLPAQHGVQGGEPRVITIQVPASALEGNCLQSLLTGPIISATMALPLNMATALLQQHVTTTLQGLQQQATTQAGLQLHNTVQQQSVMNNSSTSSATSFQNAQTGGVAQLDGKNDTSDDEEEEDEEDDDLDDDEDDDADDKDEEMNDENDGPEEEPLNSEDDVSEEDPLELFETDNVVVCQYDKITRTRNKWKFYFKDGIMNLGGKDYVFQKSNGDAEW
ncbi:Transcription factor IIA, alpha/beta subunit [Nesidiocoris tenuis]|uniref:Transcription factor IIA, alpha/beta subunit n=1 Tax=Nesidiocoris tenuis TaxID=355587 RepID=A0ABN7AQR5_9HEMI|nr:Transcription factor IIA, alpha/beta subunit [Nesidiocoris tenuis]